MLKALTCLCVPARRQVKSLENKPLTPRILGPSSPTELEKSLHFLMIANSWEIFSANRSIYHPSLNNISFFAICSP